MGYRDIYTKSLKDDDKEAGLFWKVIIVVLIIAVILYPWFALGMQNQMTATVPENPCNACMELCNQY